MKHLGWSALEFIAWNRIVRPGSVIGTRLLYSPLAAAALCCCIYRYLMLLLACCCCCCVYAVSAACIGIARPGSVIGTGEGGFSAGT